LQLDLADAFMPAIGVQGVNRDHLTGSVAGCE
jgi:hypothetical protein